MYLRNGLLILSVLMIGFCLSLYFQGEESPGTFSWDQYKNLSYNEERSHSLADFNEKIAPLTDTDVADLCAGFQAAVVDVVVDRTRTALRVFHRAAGHPTALVVAGGVAANRVMQRALARLASEAGLRLVAPPPELCGDNGAIVAWAGLERLRLGLSDDMTVPARARWPLDAAREDAEAKA